jgi:hypothetical protein
MHSAIHHSVKLILVPRLPSLSPDISTVTWLHHCGGGGVATAARTVSVYSLMVSVPAPSASSNGPSPSCSDSTDYRQEHTRPLKPWVSLKVTGGSV